MANATAYYAFDMEKNFLWDGVATIATWSQIRIENGAYAQDYFGSFSYGQYGVTGGYFTSSDFYYGSTKIYNLSGGSFNIVTVNSYIDSNNQVGLLSYIFSGNDALRA